MPVVFYRSVILASLLLNICYTGQLGSPWKTETEVLKMLPEAASRDSVSKPEVSFSFGKLA